MALEQHDKLKALLLEALAIADKIEGHDVLALYIVHALENLTPSDPQ